MQVSVVVPTYNRYKLLQRALLSLFSQTYSVAEVIVIDDGSTDDTAQIVKQFPQIRYYYQKNAGVSTARNLGIRKAHYEWIAFLDSDDEWKQDKLEQQMLLHQKNKNVLVSYTDEEWIRNTQNIKIPKKFQKIGKNAFLENISYCNIAPSSVCIHKKVFENVGVFDENLEVCEDYDLWLRVALEYEISLVPQKLIKKYAGHENQLSFKHWGMDRFRVKSLEKLLLQKNSTSYKEKIEEELLKKYTLLFKGALKYAREEDMKNYQEKIAKFRLF